MKILIVGGAGLLGRQLLLQANKLGWEVHSTFQNTRLDYGYVNWHSADASDPDAICKLAKSVRPDALIYTAAFHKVDLCETEKRMSYLVNVKTPIATADACRQIGAKFVFISTDYVFDGAKAGPYVEEDAPSPLGFYARCKHFTEEVLLSSPAGILVARTGVIYGYHPSKSNFVKWMVNEIRAGKKVTIVNDQANCPTLANDLAAAILALLKNGKEGLYHATGSQCLLRDEFALAVADVFWLDKSLIVPVPTASLNQAAKRPKNGCLRISKLEKDAGVKMSDVRRGLALMKKEWDAKEA